MQTNAAKSSESWHLDKRVPITLIATIVLQTSGILWWASKIDHRVGVAENDIAVLKRHEEEDRRDAKRVDIALERLATKLDNVLEAIRRIERRPE